MFAVLALTGRFAGARTTWLLPALAGYAVASELIQAAPVLGRSASPADVVADLLGAALGWAIARSLTR